MQSSASTPDSTPSTRDGSPGSVTLQMKHHYALANQRTPPTPDVRLYHRAVVVAQDTPGVYEAPAASRPFVLQYGTGLSCIEQCLLVTKLCSTAGCGLLL